MPIRKPPSKAKAALTDLLNELKRKLAEIDAQREEVLRDIEQTEDALNLIAPSSSRVHYSPDTTFRQKILYCLKRENKLLSISDMLSILYNVDKALKEDEKNTANSLRLTVFRMARSGDIVEHNLDDHKMKHYGLPNK